jgi:hypothetical protein
LKNVMYDKSFNRGSNDEMKSVDEKWGWEKVVRKVKEKVIYGKWEIIRNVRNNKYMMKNLGCEEDDGKDEYVDGWKNDEELKKKKEKKNSLFGKELKDKVRKK